VQLVATISPNHALHETQEVPGVSWCVLAQHVPARNLQFRVLTLQAMIAGFGYRPTTSQIQTN
jgi:hypothetical protein